MQGEADGPNNIQIEEKNVDGAVEGSYVSNNVQLERNKMYQKKMFIAVTIVAVALFGIVCLGTGIAVAYFAVLGEGK